MKTKSKNITIFYDNNILYTVDRWSQYDNPEEGRQREGDIHVSRQLRKTITMDKTLLWPNGVINYYVHSSIGDRHFSDNFKQCRNNSSEIYNCIYNKKIFYTYVSI